jgi:hypothetical protein
LDKLFSGQAADLSGHLGIEAVSQFCGGGGQVLTQFGRLFLSPLLGQDNGKVPGGIMGCFIKDFFKTEDLQKGVHGIPEIFLLKMSLGNIGVGVGLPVGGSGSGKSIHLRAAGGDQKISSSEVAVP